MPLARGCPVRVALASGPAGLTALGAGWSGAAARRRAGAELLERRAGLFRKSELRIRASFRELGEAAVHPERLLLYSDRQYRERAAPSRLGPDTPIDWSPCWEVCGRRWRFVPTFLLSYRYPSRRYGRADSNGVAAAATPAGAALAGLLELIERDSVALWWYNRARRPGISLAHTTVSCRRLLDWYAAQGRDCWALDLRSDLGVPVVAAVSRRREGPEELLLGFGAGLSLARAAEHALLELTQLHAVAEAARRSEITLEGETRRWLRTARLAAHPELARPDAVVMPRPAARRWSPSAPFARLTARLERKGIPVLLGELSRPFSRLRVLRVMAPGLRPWWPRFGPGRLYEAPVAAGWRATPLREAQLNPFGFFM